ncbi:dTDP-glucose 4,6-dehydratase [Saccharobesus litoralis]|uniref:dTDP-glucose 4,6-dehydratase n=1 Tax=Saccharobesus litoralis TaxID=2172099 RepID=A0A2S0VVC1_9ALTE|nr:dTDP-glucose 4,6-dehydratase [Saccharobesus litoralis]AWB68166.1 dTDP-glucose 4,6-dehydratase [Saccharobesus litoralis]
MQKTVLITGGAGFIGSALVRYYLNSTAHSVVNVDKLTYAANSENLPREPDLSRYHFYQQDISDSVAMLSIIKQHRPDVVFNLAAESHVDRSIANYKAFVESNVLGTLNLLDVCQQYLQTSNPLDFKFIQVSTDEVYGDILQGEFAESDAFNPSSPYSASKAAADHFINAWVRTYDFPAIVTHCSNNFGAGQHAEKLIPKIINRALQGEPIPIYGDGQQVRDWLYVDDHVLALNLVWKRGVIGSRYNIGGSNELSNIDLTHKICHILDERCAKLGIERQVKHFADLVTFVSDRPGHDIRYAVNCNKIKNELGWRPFFSFDSALASTVGWYVSKIK